MARPRWLARFIADRGLMECPNVMLPTGPMAYAAVGDALVQCAVGWDDLRWIRDAWRGPIVVKGVHTADDARRAVEAGAEGIVVSNHGGRQLDGVAATLRILPEVVAAVGDRTEVLFDGGIRRGTDIVKAIALGARAVLIGRAYVYGLGAGGGRGVTRDRHPARICCGRCGCWARIDGGSGSIVPRAAWLAVGVAIAVRRSWNTTAAIAAPATGATITSAAAPGEPLGGGVGSSWEASAMVPAPGAETVQIGCAPAIIGSRSEQVEGVVVDRPRLDGVRTPATDVIELRQLFQELSVVDERPLRRCGPRHGWRVLPIPCRQSPRRIG
jgi:hypothetical protein